MIAAIYCRVSTDEQADNFSLDSQFAACAQFARRNEYSYTDDTVFYEDESGMSLERPALSKLRKLVRAGRIQALVVHTSSRLTREIVHGEILLDELFSHGVRLFIAESSKEVRNTPDDRDFFIIENVFNRRWRNMLLEAMMRNKQHMIRSGKYVGLGLPAYGYTRTRVNGENTLVIHPEQAAVVRNIFQWYAIDGVSLGQVMKRLKGIPTPNEERSLPNLRGNGNWAASTLRKILHNETYAGTLRQKVEDERLGLPVEAIIERETWELAQQRLADNKHFAKRNAKYDYLMGKRLTCKKCGLHCFPRASDPKINQFYYVCNSQLAHTARTDCGMPFFLVHLVDGAVWDWVVQLLEQPAALKASLLQSQQELLQQNAEIHDRLSQIDSIWKRQEDRIGRMLGEYDEAPGEHTKRIMRNAIEQAEQILEELASERATLAKRISATAISDELITDLTSFAAHTKGQLDTASFATKRKLVEELGVYGSIALEDGVKVLYIQWHIHEFRVHIENTHSRNASRSPAPDAWSARRSP